MTPSRRHALLLLFFGILYPLSVGGNSNAVDKVLNGARSQVGRTLSYDPGYSRITYPGGDVPLERGVCTDVIIRAFRNADVDLQVLLHEDMSKNFSAYPKLWGLSRPDSNIDHRRVPNLMTYFKRKKRTLPITSQSQDYQAGDIVAWRLSNGLLHIGLVASEKKSDSERPLIFHNIGQGAKLEDILFSYEIIGHYRYF